MKRGRLLILSPTFHGYWRPIEAAFQRLGWETSTCCYDDVPGLWDKVQVKLRSELPMRLGGDGSALLVAQHTGQAHAAIDQAQPDRVLVIKGDTLGSSVLERLAQHKVPRSLWVYDELRRMRHTPASLGQYDSVASYSALDTAHLVESGHRALHLPLAFDSELAFTPVSLPEISFIGARYPTREQLLFQLDQAGVQLRAYGRQWSSHPIDRLRTWRLRSAPIPAHRDLSRADAYAVMAGSPATLNLHGDQDGFTMRTFEAAGVGGVELVDRADITDYYDPGAEVLPYAELDELVELIGRIRRDHRWTAGIRNAARQRTLAEHTFSHRATAMERCWA
ncbi:MAG: glycosyltransferase [Propioniciclava sp.]